MEDGATGLTYMQARYYDPTAMRFLSPDPVGVDTSTGSNFNRYNYANNNPYTFTDPDGRESACFSTGVGCGQVPITPAIEQQQATTMAAMGGAALGAALLGPAIAAAATEISTYGLVGAILGNPESVVIGGAVALETVVVTATGATGTAGLTSTLKPGPFAGASIPARSSAQTFTATERAAINEIGTATGCHNCGTTVAGTKGGNFIPDHQPVSSLNRANAPQRLLPHCIDCSRRQGGEALQEKLKQQ
jgi:RHS repeat-associated protein